MNGIKINLHILIILWWVGAACAGIAILFPQYQDFLIMGTIGWITIGTTIGLIIYEIKRIKVNDKKKMPGNAK